MSRKGIRVPGVALAFAASGLLMAATSAPGSANPRVGVKHIYPLVTSVTHSLGAGTGGLFGPTPLVYGGGPIQKGPKVYVTYWGWHGKDPSGEAARLQAFFNGVGGSGWANIQTQYYENQRGNITNPAGQLKGTWSDDSSTPPSVIQDAQIAAEAAASAQHFGGTDPDADYIIATPTGTGTVGFKTQYCAWHNVSGNLAYTNLPYITDAGTSCGKDFVNPAPAGDGDGITIVGGHEYAETITDPGAGNGWVDSSGMENGDKCAWISSGQGAAANLKLSTGTFAVQSLWSNAFKGGGGLLGLGGGGGGCVLTYP